MADSSPFARPSVSEGYPLDEHERDDLSRSLAGTRHSADQDAVALDRNVPISQRDSRPPPTGTQPEQVEQ